MECVARRATPSIFVSKYDHVLWEILLRHKAGELPCDIPLIISNHADLQPIADAFGVRFEVFKVTKATKPEVEAAEMKLMEELEIDLVVRACASIFWINPYAIDTTSTSPGVNPHAINATLHRFSRATCRSSPTSSARPTRAA